MKDLAFLERVIAEATALKQHATAEEIAGLNIHTFSGYTASRCVYGQVTGNCFSERARYLQDKCVDPASYGDIENYVFKPVDAGTIALLEYLKGERETLTPSDL